MKKLILMSAIAMSGLFYQTASAQIGFHINVNLGPRPVVVQPAPVYNGSDYYYLPDVEAYYSVNQNCYYYQDGDRWVNATYLPGRYHDYDWQHARRFAVNEPRPYLHNDVYRARYGGFEGRRDWNQRDGRFDRMYADRAHFDNIRDRGHFEDRGNNHFDNRSNNGPQNFDRNNRGNNGPQNFGGDNRDNNRPQNNDHDNRGNNQDNRGGHDDNRHGRF